MLFHVIWRGVRQGHYMGCPGGGLLRDQRQRCFLLENT